PMREGHDRPEDQLMLRLVEVMRGDLTDHLIDHVTGQQHPAQAGTLRRLVRVRTQLGHSVTSGTGHPSTGRIRSPASIARGRAAHSASSCGLMSSIPGVVAGAASATTSDTITESRELE